jgi:hypothetical protein
MPSLLLTLGTTHGTATGIALGKGIDRSWLRKVSLLFSTQFSAVLAISIFIGDVSIDYGVFLAFVVRMPWYLQIMSHCLGKNRPNPRPDHRNLVYDITADPQPAGSIFGMIQGFMRSSHWLLFIEDLLIHASATSFILMGGNSLMKALEIGSSGYIDRLTAENLFFKGIGVVWTISFVIMVVLFPCHLCKAQFGAEFKKANRRMREESDREPSVWRLNCSKSSAWAKESSEEKLEINFV